MRTTSTHTHSLSLFHTTLIIGINGRNHCGNIEMKESRFWCCSVVESHGYWIQYTTCRIANAMPCHAMPCHTIEIQVQFTDLYQTFRHMLAHLIGQCLGNLCHSCHATNQQHTGREREREKERYTCREEQMNGSERRFGTVLPVVVQQLDRALAGSQKVHHIELGHFGSWFLETLDHCSAALYQCIHLHQRHRGHHHW
jgi:hypothetical protein